MQVGSRSRRFLALASASLREQWGRGRSSKHTAPRGGLLLRCRGPPRSGHYQPAAANVAGRSSWIRRGKKAVAPATIRARDRDAAAQSAIAACFVTMSEGLRPRSAKPHVRDVGVPSHPPRSGRAQNIAARLPDGGERGPLLSSGDLSASPGAGVRSAIPFAQPRRYSHEVRLQTANTTPAQRREGGASSTGAKATSETLSAFEKPRLSAELRVGSARANRGFPYPW